MTAKTTLIALLLFLLSACTNRMEKELIGRWQGVELLEEGEPLAIDPAEIRFEFFSKNDYSFASTLNYREAGHYRVQSEYLFTTDTTRADATEKVIRILQLEVDTLVMEMKEQEKPRELKLLRATQ